MPCLSPLGTTQGNQRDSWRQNTLRHCMGENRRVSLPEASKSNLSQLNHPARSSSPVAPMSNMSKKEKRWLLTWIFLPVPFLIEVLFVGWNYSNTFMRYLALSSFGIPISTLFTIIPIWVAPITPVRNKLIFGIVVFIFTAFFLVPWSILLAFAHGDSL